MPASPRKRRESTTITSIDDDFGIKGECSRVSDDEPKTVFIIAVSSKCIQPETSDAAGLSPGWLPL